MYAFIDESGDHNLLKIDDQYPLFALGALIINKENLLIVDARLNAIKSRFFGNSDFIFHSSELKRPLGKRSDPRNQPMLDKDFRKTFYQTVDEEILKEDLFTIVVCFVDKKKMHTTYAYPIDPYYYAFENLLNRILRYTTERIILYAERRGETLDSELCAEYERLCKIGIRFFPASKVSASTELNLIQKKENVNGLQLIDLLLSTIVRDYMGKTHKMLGNDLNPELIKKRYACPPTIFPQPNT